MTPTDVALLDEAHWLIDPGFRRFGHVVVDEAQNLTPMELRMTVRRARGQSLTILGDLAQRTADAGVSSWERVLARRASDAHEVCELSVSYRVPNEFLVLAGTLLPAGAPAPRGVREAPFPPAARATRESAPAAAREAVRLPARSAASAWSRRTRASTTCARRWPASTYADAIHASGAGINLLDLHVAKGLEFDAIVVVEPAAILRRAPRRRRRRALHGAHPRDAGAGDRARASRCRSPCATRGVLRTETDRNGA